MTRKRRTITAGYAGILLAALALAFLAAWNPLAARIDGDAYDSMVRWHPTQPRPVESVILAIDEETLASTGGMRRLRRTLAEALAQIAPAKPRVVAVDVIFGEPDPQDDPALERALASTPNVVLAAELTPAGAWQQPIPALRAHAAAVGHIYGVADPVSRVVPLEKVAGRTRLWALALEAYRLSRGAPHIEETPSDIDVAGARIPASRLTSADRAVYIRYLPEGSGIPHISPAQLRRDPGLAARFRDKVVFVGVTAQSAARDRLVTPYDTMMVGVEINAQAYETLAGGRFYVPAPATAVVLTCLLFAAAAGAAFAFLSGWPAYISGAAIVLASHALPHLAFARDIVFPYTAPVAAAWLSVGAAAAWQYFVVRRQLRKSEADKSRYQQAIHFVTHEMRSPLTAIQGSSELMGRYALTEEKRLQIANMINSESKRLARMIQTFLDIERLTAGEMEIRSEPVEVAALLEACVARAHPLAERKQIELRTERAPEITVTGDRELIEYAVYNLLTNAIKYSPAETVVTVSPRLESGLLKIAVRDQGIGMDAQELRSIFQKFYRTNKAEASGESGTGIGLSLVEQIVTHHGGSMEVASAPGQGSCFTMVLPRGTIASRPASRIAAS